MEEIPLEPLRHNYLIFGLKAVKRNNDVNEKFGDQLKLFLAVLSSSSITLRIKVPKIGKAMISRLFFLRRRRGITVFQQSLLSYFSVRLFW